MFGAIRLSPRIEGEHLSQQYDEMNQSMFRHDGGTKRQGQKIGMYGWIWSPSQSMSDLDRYTACWSGRIHQVDGDEVAHLSHDMISRLILDLYLRYKDDFADRMRGDFVICIIDHSTDQVKLIRDSNGSVPLYYEIRMGCILFSTELKRLSWCKDSIHDIDEKYIILSSGQLLPNTYERTWFRDIRRVPHAHVFTFDASGMVDKYRYFRYAQLRDKCRSNLSIEECLDEFAQQIKDAVHRQINDLSAIDTHFSGGLDSTGISAITHQYAVSHDIPYRSYCNGLREVELHNNYGVKDERDFLEKVTKDSRLPKPTLVYGCHDRSEQIKLWFNMPLFAHMRNYLEDICHRVHDQGGEAILSGFGGDECITYNQYPVYLTHALQAGRLKTFWQHGKVYGVKRMIYAMLYQWEWFDPIINWLRPGIFWARYRAVQDHIPVTETITSVSDICYTLTDEITNYLASPYMAHRREREQEYASYYDIEMRYPYLDRELLTFFLSLPIRYKMYRGQGRRLYREAIRRWVPSTAFIEQRKSRIATVPYQFLQYKMSMDSETKEISWHRILAPYRGSIDINDQNHGIYVALNEYLDLMSKQTYTPVSQCSESSEIC